MQKYGFDDARPVLERASARETAARVALGTVAQAVPARRRSASRSSRTSSSIGAVDAPYDGPLPGPGDRDGDRRQPGAGVHPEATAAG